MVRFLHVKLPKVSRKSSVVSLALLWLLGLLSGTALSVPSSTVIPLMRTAANSGVSIISLLTAICLPFLLSAFAVYIHETWLLLPIAFGKAFLVSYLGIGVLLAYGSAGWLVRALLMFSECCSLPVLFWYWLRHLSDWGQAVHHTAAIAALAVLFICSLDYCVVSPFLATVIS